MVDIIDRPLVEKPPAVEKLSRNKGQAYKVVADSKTIDAVLGYIDALEKEVLILREEIRLLYLPSGSGESFQGRVRVS